MAKRLSCRDAGADCDFVACADSEEEIFAKVADHAKKDHGMSDFSREMFDEKKSAIREVEQC